jgi:hypothetical protein
MNPNRVDDLLQNVFERNKDFIDLPEVYDDGFGHYWVGDGFHRLLAFRKAGRERIKVRVREGTMQEAMMHALGANAEHGQPRSHDDLRRAISLALEDKTMGRWSDVRIAKLVRCSDKTVAAVRERLGLRTNKRVRLNADGTETEVDISGHTKRGKKRFAFEGKVNTFHDLPDPIRETLRNFLQEVSRLPKAEYSFARTWSGHSGKVPGHATPYPGQKSRPLRQDFQDSGMMEDELYELMKAAPTRCAGRSGNGTPLEHRHADTESYIHDPDSMRLPVRVS